MGNLRLFQGGVFTSILVFNLLSVAGGWYVYEQTRNPFDLGLVGLAQFVPAFLMTLVSGQLADRYDRRRLMILGNSLLVLCSLLLWALTHQPFARGSYLAVVALIGFSRSIEAPATAAYLPELVPLPLFARAVAWNSSIKQVAKLLGPAAGGLLYAFVGNAGAVFLVGAVGSLIAVLAFVSIHAPSVVRTVVPVSREGLKEGLRCVVGNPLILGAVSLDLCAGLLGGAVALLPVFAVEVLNVGPTGLGFLRSAPALGAFVMALSLGQQPIEDRVGKRMIESVLAFGVLTVVFGLSTSFWLSLTALLLLGAADNVSAVLRQSLIQIATPSSLRGRVSSVNQIFVVTSNQLGEFEAGAAAALFGAGPAVVVGGVATCLVAWGWPKLFPDLFGFRNFDDMLALAD